MKHLDINQIKDIIPHRHPFLLLDYVEDYEPGEYAVAYKCVSFSYLASCSILNKG